MSPSTIITALTVGACMLGFSAAAWASWLYERGPRPPHYLKDDDGHDILQWDEQRRQ